MANDELLLALNNIPIELIYVGMKVEYIPYRSADRCLYGTIIAFHKRLDFLTINWEYPDGDRPAIGARTNSNRTYVSVGKCKKLKKLYRLINEK